MHLTGRTVQSHIYHQKNETYYTAVLQLGDMFDGGGASIVHYFVQIFKTTVEITDLTYSVDVMYNDTVEPPNRGHFGTAVFVLSSEVVLFSEVV